MTIDVRTIAELEKDGFTHIDAHCAGCGRIVQMPFKLLLTRERITKATIAERRRRYRCQNCGSSHAARFAPWRPRGQHGLMKPARRIGSLKRQSLARRPAPRYWLAMLWRSDQRGANAWMPPKPS
jgi:DNA-directed RNA polymerase subunit RPC12/RpoP